MIQQERIELFNLGPIHLGDNIACTNLIYNLALEHNFKAKVHYHSYWVGKQLLDIFHYEDRIEMCKRHFRLPFNFTVGKCLKTKNKAVWTHRRFGASTFDASPIENFKLPDCKLEIPPKKSYQCFQVSSRSHHSGKPRLNIIEIKKIRQLFDHGNAFFISNVGTRLFLPDTKVHFANLINQSKFLLGCESFFGVDSGMSHLAGTLKVKGDIVAQGLRKNFSDCIQQAYEIMYPSLIVHPRKILR